LPGNGVTRSDRGTFLSDARSAGERILFGLALICGVASGPGVDHQAFAQTPPTERELRIYAGLHDAAARGDVSEIEQLIAEGEKPTIQDANSRAPLHVAAFLRRHDAARALLRLGADPNALDAERYDIITIAAVNDDLEMLKIALAAGGNARAITSPYAGTALIAAAHRGHVEIVRALIAAKAPLNHVNNLGWTALLEAVVLGNGSAKYAAIVDALVKAGADINIADRHGTTALGHARTRGYSQIARILENAGGR
jgi:ankyrin repeat protein